MDGLDAICPDSLKQIDCLDWIKKTMDESDAECRKFLDQVPISLEEMKRRLDDDNALLVEPELAQFDVLLDVNLKDLSIPELAIVAELEGRAAVQAEREIAGELQEHIKGMSAAERADFAVELDTMNQWHRTGFVEAVVIPDADVRYKADGTDVESITFKPILKDEKVLYSASTQQSFDPESSGDDGIPQAPPGDFAPEFVPGENDQR